MSLIEEERILIKILPEHLGKIAIRNLCQLNWNWKAITPYYLEILLCDLQLKRNEMTSWYLFSKSVEIYSEYDLSNFVR